MAHKLRDISVLAAIFALIELTTNFMLAPILAQAQEDETTITYGEIVSGEITDDSYISRYFFRGEADDLISISMRSGYCGDLDSQITLLTEAGVRIAEDDDSGADDNALIIGFTLPQSGTYTILASRAGGEDGDTTGDFSLAIDRLAYRPVEVGTPVSGALSTQGLPELFQTELKAGDLVRVGATSTADGIDPVITVLDPSNTLIAVDDNSGGLQMPLVDPLIVPVTGTYSIAVFAGNNIGGDFELSILPSRGNMIGLDEPISDTLSQDNRTGIYFYRGLAGESVAFRVRRTVDEFEPFISIYQGIPSEATRLASGRGSRLVAVSLEVILPADGLYVVTVSRNGAAFGSFELVATRPLLAGGSQ